MRLSPPKLLAIAINAPQDFRMHKCRNGLSTGDWSTDPVSEEAHALPHPPPTFLLLPCQPLTPKPPSLWRITTCSTSPWLAHSALAQDTPQPADVYLNQILNLAVAYCTAEMRAEIEEFLAQKKYLPAVDLKIVT